MDDGGGPPGNQNGIIYAQLDVARNVGKYGLMLGVTTLAVGAPPCGFQDTTQEVALYWVKGHILGSHEAPIKSTHLSPAAHPSQTCMPMLSDCLRLFNKLPGDGWRVLSLINGARLLCHLSRVLHSTLGPLTLLFPGNIMYSGESSKSVVPPQQRWAERFLGSAKAPLVRTKRTFGFLALPQEVTNKQTGE